jgi:hypothetical protein
MSLERKKVKFDEEVLETVKDNDAINKEFPGLRDVYDVVSYWNEGLFIRDDMFRQVLATRNHLLKSLDDLVGYDDESDCYSDDRYAIRDSLLSTIDDLLCAIGMEAGHELYQSGTDVSINHTYFVIFDPPADYEMHTNDGVIKIVKF